MPGFDGRGPLGQGPMTGKGQGLCMLKIPDGKSGFMTGFVGLSGEPFSSERRAAMPGGDGTGPMGAGPMTGRGAGFCAGYPVPGYMNPIGGRGGFGGGRGGGWGRGRRWRHWFYATGVPGWARPAWGYPPPAGPEDELSSLEGQSRHLEEYLKDLQGRIAELKGQQKT